MEWVRMVAGDKIAGHSYAGKRLIPGQEFDCEVGHVSVMEACGHRRKSGASKTAGSYDTRDMVAAGRSRAARVKQ